MCNRQIFNLSCYRHCRQQAPASVNLSSAHDMQKLISNDKLGPCEEAHVTDPAPTRQPAGRPLRTLADKVNWLIGNAHPAGRGPLSNAEVAALMERVTGETFSHTTIWKLRNGQAANPQMRLIEALARTFGVPPAFFFPGYDAQQAGLSAEQVELLALVRDASVTSVQLRALLELNPQARQAIADLVAHTARSEAQRLRAEQH